MLSAHAKKTKEKLISIDDSMEVLLKNLDEAIDDMELGRVQTVEETWREIDKI